MDVLYSDLEENLDKPMEIFVYNRVTDLVRVAVVMPTNDWGPNGGKEDDDINNSSGSILGAEIAYGYMHSLQHMLSNLLDATDSGSAGKSATAACDEDAATAPAATASESNNSALGLEMEGNAELPVSKVDDIIVANKPILESQHIKVTQSPFGSH